MRTRRPTHVAWSLAALPVAALALAACGGGGDGDGDAANDGVATLGTTTTTVASDDDTGEQALAPANGSDPTSSGDGTDTADGTETAASDASGASSSDPEQAMLDYADCMRDNGVDMPDPEFTGDGGMMMTMGAAEGEGPDPEEYEAAHEECEHFMEAARSNIEIDPEEQAERQAEMLEFAECMRDQGIDMPDPQFDGNGGMTMQIGEPGDEEANPRSDEEFAAASEECGQDGGMMPALPVEGDE